MTYSPSLAIIGRSAAAVAISGLPRSARSALCLNSATRTAWMAWDASAAAALLWATPIAQTPPTPATPTRTLNAAAVAHARPRRWRRVVSLLSCCRSWGCPWRAGCWPCSHDNHRPACRCHAKEREPATSLHRPPDPAAFGVDDGNFAPVDQSVRCIVATFCRSVYLQAHRGGMRDDGLLLLDCFACCSIPPYGLRSKQEHWPRQWLPFCRSAGLPAPACWALRCSTYARARDQPNFNLPNATVQRSQPHAAAGGCESPTHPDLS